MEFQINVDGQSSASELFDGVAYRCVRLRPAFRQAEGVLERGERRVFSPGHLVRTGRLRASLTQPDANDAVRKAHNNELVFGTAVPYARAAASRAGEAVLVVDARESREIASLTLEYVVNGV